MKSRLLLYETLLRAKILLDFTKEMCIQIFWTCMYIHKQEHNPERGAGTYDDCFFLFSMNSGQISQIVMDKFRDFPVLCIVMAKIVLSTHGLCPKYFSQNSKGGIGHPAILNTESDC